MWTIRGPGPSLTPQLPAGGRGDLGPTCGACQSPGRWWRGRICRMSANGLPPLFPAARRRKGKATLASNAAMASGTAFPRRLRDRPARKLVRHLPDVLKDKTTSCWCQSPMRKNAFLATAGVCRFLSLFATCGFDTSHGCRLYIFNRRRGNKLPVLNGRRPMFDDHLRLPPRLVAVGPGARFLLLAGCGFVC